MLSETEGFPPQADQFHTRSAAGQKRIVKSKKKLQHDKCRMSNIEGMFSG
jgi:hypothetical protein